MDSSHSLVRKPLYRQIADLIRKSYVEGKESSVRLPPERELAAVLGVSAVTIRTALRELESQNLIERRQGSGTYVSDKPTGSGHIGLLLEADISNPSLSPYYIKLLQEVRMGLLKAGHSTRPYLGHLRLGVEIGELTCREFFEELREGRIKGVVAIFAQDHPSWTHELKKRDIPFIGSRSAGGATVGADMTKIARTILSAFREKGHQRLAMLGQDDHNRKLPNLAVRLQSLACEYGIAFDEKASLEKVSGWKAGEGREALRKIWNSAGEKPDCIFIGSDLLANECLDEIDSMRNGGHLGVGVFGSDAVIVRPHENLVRCIIKVSAVAHSMINLIERGLKRQALPNFTEVPFYLQTSLTPVTSTPTHP